MSDVVWNVAGLTITAIGSVVVAWIKQRPTAAAPASPTMRASAEVSDKPASSLIVVKIDSITINHFQSHNNGG